MPHSKLEKDYLYMAYAGIMAKVGAAPHKLWGGGVGGPHRPIAGPPPRCGTPAPLRPSPQSCHIEEGDEEEKEEEKEEEDPEDSFEVGGGPKMGWGSLCPTAPPPPPAPQLRCAPLGEGDGEAEAAVPAVAAAHEGGS